MNADVVYPIVRYDDGGNICYYEDSYGHWIISKYDEYGNRKYVESSGGFRVYTEYQGGNGNSGGRRVYYADSVRGVQVSDGIRRKKIDRLLGNRDGVINRLFDYIRLKFYIYIKLRPTK
jgi:hypothetical protein